MTRQCLRIFNSLLHISIELSENVCAFLMFLVDLQFIGLCKCYTYTSIDPFLEQYKNSIWFLITSHFLWSLTKYMDIFILLLERNKRKTHQKLKTYVMADCSTPTEAFILQFACVYPCAVSFCFAHSMGEEHIYNQRRWDYTRYTNTVTLTVSM